MSLIVVGSMAFDAIETPFGKSDKIIGGAENLESCVLYHNSTNRSYGFCL